MNYNKRYIALAGCVLVAVFGVSVLIVNKVSHSSQEDAADTTPVSQQSADVPPSATVIAPVQAASCNQAGIQKLVDSVSEANLRRNLQELVQDDSQPTPNTLVSRHVSSPANQQKVDWVSQQLAGYGLQAANQRFTHGKYTVDNIVSRLDGSAPNNYYAISGHIDSTNRDESYHAGEPAPGGDDNGSGIVAMMEAGRVLKTFQSCLKSSVEFVGFNYEESDGEYGSDYYVKHRDGRSFKGLLNMDMVAYGPKADCVINYYNKNSREKALADQLQTNGSKYGIGLQMKTLYENDEEHDTDSSNFWDANLPSVHLYNCNDHDPNYHSKNDTLQDINWSQLTKTTKTVVATAAELAMQ